MARSKGGKRKAGKTIDWILKKKELYRARGKEGVPRDSKCVCLRFFARERVTDPLICRFTGRSRKARF